MIQPIILEDGDIRDYDFFLRSIYDHEWANNPKEWGMGYFKKTIRIKFYYDGPLPIGEEILVVGKYVLKRHAKGITTDQELFFVRPFWLLTDNERMSSAIIAASYDPC